MGKSVDQAAFDALNAILGLSIKRRREYGGMIYLLDGEAKATEARTDDQISSVDVGHTGLNKGCPAGTTPMAYFHTHPVAVYERRRVDYNAYSPDDKQIAVDYELDAYMGSVDGSFMVFRYKKGIAAKPEKLPGRLKNYIDD